MEPRNRFQGINSASLCSLAGRYDNPILTRCLAPIDFFLIPAQVDCDGGRRAFLRPAPHPPLSTSGFWTDIWRRRKRASLHLGYFVHLHEAARRGRKGGGRLICKLCGCQFLSSKFRRLSRVAAFNIYNSLVLGQSPFFLPQKRNI